MPAQFRLATPNDAPQVQSIYAPYCQTPISFEADAPSVDEMRARIVKTLETLPWLVCVQDDDVLGYVYASAYRERAAYRWSVDTTVYIHEQRQRRGLGRALYTALFEILRLQGYVNAYAGVTLPNPGSVRLHESMGFEKVGVYRHVGYKYGTWHDVGWYEKLLQPLPPEPAFPKPLGEVVSSPEFELAIQAGF
jgi:phosphinothricin acetyltransferase